MIDQFHFTAADRERIDRQQAMANRLVLVMCAIAAVLIFCGVIW